MEPMTLGSAPSSPSSPGTNPNFLPSFLMGDGSQPTTPTINTSPGRNRTTPGTLRKLGQICSTPADPRNYQSKLFDQSIESIPNLNNQNKQFTPHKPGPPSQGLFDTLDQKKKITSPIYNTTLYADSPNFSRNYSISGDDYILNNSKNHHYSANNFSKIDRIDTHWVTVFGFPPSALSVVLAQLSNCGVIVEKKLPPQGNWVHVKYQNLNDVPRALALNGRCLNNSIMIGVNLYYHKENKENETVFSPIRARSLRQSFVSPNESSSVLPPQNVPQKSTGLVSKAFEYVFGW